MRRAEKSNAKYCQYCIDYGLKNVTRGKITPNRPSQKSTTAYAIKAQLETQWNYVRTVIKHKNSILTKLTFKIQKGRRARLQEQ